MRQHTLVFGGARSGKSTYAEKLAAAGGKPVIFVATAAAGDEEMATRIARHRHQRSRQYAAWATVEEPLALGPAIARASMPDNVVLVDCLTVWLSNLLFCEARDFPDIGQIDPPVRMAQEREAFLQALVRVPGDVVLVSNEVGMGIVPQGAVSRWFVDEAGRLNQAVAAICDRVQFIAAGLPLILKGQAACP